MNELPFHRSGPGKLYRGNLHAHSLNSDGGMTPEQVCAAYRQQGYDFLTITDHYSQEYNYPITDTTMYRDNEFTTLIGAELHAPALANGQEWHILASGLPLDFGGLRHGETGPQLAERAVNAGAFVGLAHPAWYGATVEDLQSIPVAHAVEVFNEICGALSDRSESWFLVDQLLVAGRRVTAFGADDAHFFRSSDELPDPSTDGDDLTKAESRNGSGAGETLPSGFSAWVWVHAERLDPDLLVESLKAGRYYTSQGPRIHDIMVSEDKTELTVINSPAVSVYVTGDPGIYTLGANHAKQITKSTFSISDHKDSYCRVIVVDAAGKRAWSNPIWLD